MAKLGMTLGELRQVLPEDAKIYATELGVDLPSGMEVNFYGELQFELAFDNGDKQITDQSKIEMIVVRNPSYRTAEGVGAGTRVKEAIAHYGAATLSYGWDNILLYSSLRSYGADNPEDNSKHGQIISLRNFYFSSRVSTFQSRTLSAEAETRVRPSGLNFKSLTPLV